MNALLNVTLDLGTATITIGGVTVTGAATVNRASSPAGQTRISRRPCSVRLLSPRQELLWASQPTPSTRKSPAWVTQAGKNSARRTGRSAPGSISRRPFFPDYLIDPVANIPDYWDHVDALTARAIELTIWHLDESGYLVEEPGPDPEFEAKVATFRFLYEREQIEDVKPRPVAKPVVEKIRPPTPESAIAFNTGRPRAFQQLSDPEEDARLVAEFLARKKVTQLSAGYARNAK